MKRPFVVLAVVVLLVVASGAFQPAQAAAGDYLYATYAGGAYCDGTGIYVPMLVESSLAAPLPFTQINYIDGVAMGATGGTQAAGYLSYVGSFGGSIVPTHSVPYTYQIVADFSGQFVITANGVCFGGTNVVVSIDDTSENARILPAAFTLRTITCDTAVYDAPGGKALATGEALKAGQTWYVNPTPVTAADGSSWTEFFPSGARNAYIPTSCVG